MIRNYKKEDEVRGRIFNDPPLKAMLSIIGLNSIADIKISRRGYVYFNARRNSYHSKNENLFIEECQKGFVKNHGSGNYSLTHKGKKYIELVAGIIIMDNDGFVPDF